MPATKKVTRTVTNGLGDLVEQRYSRSTTRRDFGTLRQLQSGRWQASYIGPDGNRHKAPKTFVTKADGRAWLTTQEHNIIQGEWAPNSATVKHEKQIAQAERFSRYAESWVKTQKNRKGKPLAPKTQSEYRRLIKGPLASFANLILPDITPMLVRKWHTKEQDSGNYTQTSNAYSLLSSIMKQAVEDDLIPTNPCRVRGGGSTKTKDVTGKKVKIPTPVEYGIIESFMPDEWRALVHIAGLSALRFGEQTELRRKDVYDDGTDIVIKVTRNATKITKAEIAEQGLVVGKPKHGYTLQRDGYIVGPPKTDGSNREVPMPGMLAEPIRRHLAEYVPDNPEALLFPSSSGGHLNQSTHHRHWNKARISAGRPDLHWHDLRHYGLSQYAAAGATLAEIMERGGHRSVSAAMIYQQPLGRGKELANIMAERIKAASLQAA